MSINNLIVYPSLWQALRARTAGKSVVKVDGGYAVVSNAFKIIMRRYK